MGIVADALQPSIVLHLLNAGSVKKSMTLADLIVEPSSAYNLAVTDLSRALVFDFREPGVVVPALAADCFRFSCASFQTVSKISEEMAERDGFAWSLIKLYYSAFYAGHALLRTFGEGCSFFYKHHTDHIAAINSAMGVVPNFRIDSGLYHGVLSADSTVVSYTKIQGQSGGAHEAFWFVFGNKLRSISESILAGPLTTLDAQAVFAKIDYMLQVLGRKGGNSWLSNVRNDVQYRQHHQVWFPDAVRPQFRKGLGRLAAQWSRDPVNVDIQNHKWELLGDFVATCAFIISLCRAVLERIAERSSLGARSFVRLGPWSFLNDIARSRAALR